MYYSQQGFKLQCLDYSNIISYRFLEDTQLIWPAVHSELVTESRRFTKD